MMKLMINDKDKQLIPLDKEMNADWILVITNWSYLFFTTKGEETKNPMIRPKEGVSWDAK